MPEPLVDALADLRPLLLDPDGLRRAVASGRRRGTAPGWRRAELRRVDLASGPHLQVVTYDETQAHTANHAYGPAAEGAVDALLGQPFGSWHVESARTVVQLRVTKKGDAQVHRAAPASTSPVPPDTAHDRRKPRLLDPSQPVLRELGISDGQGRVKPSRQAKYRQVEELLRALDAALPPSADGSAGDPLRVVDLGCGNASLTFAAYAYLAGPRGLAVDLVGVDVKEQARAHGTEVAQALGWTEHVRFVQGTALDAPLDGDAVDVVLALHACDTATDEALARAVRLSAPLVLAAPCCHHDVQRQLAAGAGAPAPYGPLTRYGILRERFADVLTDALRAAVLRLLGYRVEVVEFVGSEHTPRNTLIRAVRTGTAPTAEQVREYEDLTTTWGVVPRLAQLLAAELAPVLDAVGTVRPAPGEAPPVASARRPPASAPAG